MARGTVLASAAAAAVLLAIAGCTASPPSPGASASAPATTEPAATAAPEATSEPAAEPSLRPELAASENLAYFDLVNQRVIAANPEAQGRDFVDALVAAGFDKAAMQVTADTTTIGDPADSIQFSVRFQNECLVGQYGTGSDGYHGAVRPLLGTGACLVGQTRPIDW
jgi:hypothetical protein